jgi:hypothetical protein
MNEPMTPSRTAPRHAARFIPVALTLLLAPAAHAAGLGESGGITVSAERLFGYTHTKDQLGNGGNTFSGTRSDFAILMASPSSAYSVPRLGLDVSIGNGLTVGGNFGFVVGSTTRGYSGSFGPIGISTTDDLDQTTFVLAPRAGYDLALNDKLHLWARGGLSYFHTSVEGNNTEVTLNGMALTLEPTFVYLANPNVGVTLGLTFDLPFTGEREDVSANNNSFKRDYTVRQIGLLVGLALNLF